MTLQTIMPEQPLAFIAGLLGALFNWTLAAFGVGTLATVATDWIQAICGIGCFIIALLAYFFPSPLGRFRRKPKKGPKNTKLP